MTEDEVYTEEEIFTEWKNSAGSEMCRRFEENVRLDSYSSSPTPDEPINSELEFMAENFEEWAAEYYPDLMVTDNEEGYPEVLVNYWDSVFDAARNQA